MKNFFSILLLTISCLTTLNLCAAQQDQLPDEFCEQLLQKATDQTEVLKEKMIRVMKVKAALIKRIREENNADILHAFSEHFFDALVAAGFTQAEAAEYAFGKAENN